MARKGIMATAGYTRREYAEVKRARSYLNRVTRLRANAPVKAYTSPFLKGYLKANRCTKTGYGSPTYRSEFLDGRRMSVSERKSYYGGGDGYTARDVHAIDADAYIRALGEGRTSRMNAASRSASKKKWKGRADRVLRPLGLTPKRKSRRASPTSRGGGWGYRENQHPRDWMGRWTKK